MHRMSCDVVSPTRRTKAQSSSIHEYLALAVLGVLEKCKEDIDQVCNYSLDKPPLFPYFPDPLALGSN